MRQLLRSRPSPAMVVACIALLVALGGTSIAAVQALPKGSVGTAQLKNNSVSNAKLRNDSVSSGKLKNGSVSSGKIAKDAVTANEVKDGSLVAADLAAGVIPTGSAGITGLERTESVSASNSLSPKTLTPTCPTGKKVIGGGAQVTGAGTPAITIVKSFPDSDGTKWNIMAVENNITGSTWQVTAYALCAIVAS